MPAIGLERSRWRGARLTALWGRQLFSDVGRRRPFGRAARRRRDGWHARTPTHTHERATTHTLTILTQTVAANANSLSMPFLEQPKNLDGSMAGDVGFDPLGLSEIDDLGVDLYWLREAELKHGRVAMLATIGYTYPEMPWFAQAFPGDAYSHSNPIKAALAVPPEAWAGTFVLDPAHFKRGRKRLSADELARLVSHDDVQEYKREKAAAWLSACTPPALADLIVGGGTARSWRVARCRAPRSGARCWSRCSSPRPGRTARASARRGAPSRSSSSSRRATTCPRRRRCSTAASARWTRAR